MNIDVNKLNQIKDELNELKNDNDVLFVDEDGKNKYAIISIETYDKLEYLLSLLPENNQAPAVKIIGNNVDLSYEEYERIKNSIMEAVEKTFKPKAEKLN